MSPWFFDVGDLASTSFKIQSITSEPECGAVTMELEAQLSDGTDASSYITLNGMTIDVDFTNRLN